MPCHFPSIKIEKKFQLVKPGAQLSKIYALTCRIQIRPSLARTYLIPNKTGVLGENSLLALYPGGISKREPPSYKAPRQPTIYMLPVLYST